MSTASWIAALATVVVAVGVIAAAWFARTASVALSRQLTAQYELTAQLAETLQLQARELGQSHEERRRAQACRVFIALDRDEPAEACPSSRRVAATVRNASDQPVYDMYVIWQVGTVRMGKPDSVARLLPGEQVCFERGSPADGSPADGSPADGSPADPATLTAFLTFRDTAGVRWTVREDGTLSDVASASHA